MESLKNKAQVQDLRRELLKNYRDNMKDPTFLELVKKFKLTEDMGALYNSNLEDSVWGIIYILRKLVIFLI